MTPIIICGPCFSGATNVAAALRDNYGYHHVDDTVVVERAAAWGVPQDTGRAVLQTPPRLVRRGRRRQRACLNLLRAALAEELGGRPTVYCGNAGYLLLNEGGKLLRIRVIAPLESRIQNARNSLKLSRSQAAACIRKADRARREWVRWFYGCDGEDPALYDLVINSENMGAGDACTAIHEAATHWEGCGCEAVLADLALSSRANAVLELEPSTAHFGLHALAHAGAVAISGRIPDEWKINDVRRAVSSIPGVSGVDLAGVKIDNSGRTAPPGLYKWAAALLIVALGLVLQVLLRSTAGQRLQTITGVITDTKCGAAHSRAQAARASACVNACVKLDTAIKYALYNGTRLYVLSDQSTPARFAAREVRVRGVVNEKAKTLAVRSIAPMP